MNQLVLSQIGWHLEHSKAIVTLIGVFPGMNAKVFSQPGAAAEQLHTILTSIGLFYYACDRASLDRTCA